MMITRRAITWCMKVRLQESSLYSKRHVRSLSTCVRCDKRRIPFDEHSTDMGEVYEKQKDEKEDLKQFPQKVYDATNDGKELWKQGLYTNSSSTYERSQSKYSFRPGNLDPNETSIVLFPGQGTQYVGMGKDMTQYPHVKEMYEVASEILGYNLYELSIKGPKEMLDKTAHQQPAILVASLAAVEKLRAENPNAIQNCIGTAGFSMGEITALTFAGSFSFEDAVKLIKLRAEVMQTASEATPGGMMTVFTSHHSKLALAVKTAKEFIELRENNDEEKFSEILDCKIASHLHPDCKVVAGNIQALEFMHINKDVFNLRRMKPLAVSGAFHTELMGPAVEPFMDFLDGMDIVPPQIPVHRNINGKPYYSIKDILTDLPLQMVKPVKWEQTMHILYERQNDATYPATYVCGPGVSLKLILGKINNKAANSCTVIKC